MPQLLIAFGLCVLAFSLCRYVEIHVSLYDLPLDDEPVPKSVTEKKEKDSDRGILGVVRW